MLRHPAAAAAQERPAPGGGERRNKGSGRATAGPRLLRRLAPDVPHPARRRCSRWTAVCHWRAAPQRAPRAPARRALTSRAPPARTPVRVDRARPRARARPARPRTRTAGSAVRRRNSACAATPRSSTSSTPRTRCGRRTAARPTRLERALAMARRMRLDLTDVPSGVATITDRVLPNIFPTGTNRVHRGAGGNHRRRPAAAEGIR